MNFVKCEITIDSKFIYIKNSNVQLISHANEITSTSRLVQLLQNKKVLQGSLYFTYNGERIIDIAMRTQWKND